MLRFAGETALKAALCGWESSSIKLAQSLGERNNKPDFVALRQAPAMWWRGPVDNSRIVNPPKKRAGGPLLEVDLTPGMTRDFCMAEGKEKRAQGVAKRNP